MGGPGPGLPEAAPLWVQELLGQGAGGRPPPCSPRMGGLSPGSPWEGTDRSAVEDSGGSPCLGPCPQLPPQCAHAPLRRASCRPWGCAKAQHVQLLWLVQLISTQWPALWLGGDRKLGLGVPGPFLPRHPGRLPGGGVYAVPAGRGQVQEEHGGGERGPLAQAG